MLKHMRAPLNRGVTLIELLIVLAVIAVALALGAPSYFQWNQNSQIRSAAESMLAGMKLARSESLKRNALVRFQLMAPSGASCALATSSSDGDWAWAVSLNSAAGYCDAADSNTDPYILRLKANGETSNTRFGATQSEIDFDGLGRVTPTPAGDVVINVTNPTGGACIAASGPMRCLRIIVAAGGQARLCDPSVSGATDPRTC